MNEFLLQPFGVTSPLYLWLILVATSLILAYQLSNLGQRAWRRYTALCNDLQTARALTAGDAARWQQMSVRLSVAAEEIAWLRNQLKLAQEQRDAADEAYRRTSNQDGTIARLRDTIVEYDACLADNGIDFREWCQAQLDNHKANQSPRTQSQIEIDTADQEYQEYLRDCEKPGFRLSALECCDRKRREQEEVNDDPDASYE